MYKKQIAAVEKKEEMIFLFFCTDICFLQKTFPVSSFHLLLFTFISRYHNKT
ncbi:hypothetical protein D920_01728 [Enterococcus faecalis 13-SD-W-01]|nr:hypothetical protein D920_01728 [Enterococcus faecalis 13-SD-W-01]